MTEATDDRRVEIRTNGLRAEVLLDGVDIASDLIGFQLSAAVADVPVLVLQLGYPAAGKALYEGMPRVVVGEPADPGPAAAAFLSAMDWKMLEQAALNRPDLDNEPGALTRAMLAQLIEWANGRP